MSDTPAPEIPVSPAAADSSVALPWIVEGVMTTLDAAGVPNIAPMGPRVDARLSRFILRPFRTSTTYRNLKAAGQGVFHITDDALFIARAAIGRLDRYEIIPMQPAAKVKGVILTGACRYHELAVVSMQEDELRATIEMHPVHDGRLRDFFGFNRARHAVIEAAILATRVHLTEADAVLRACQPLQVMVDKTGGPDEHQAMTELMDHVRRLNEAGDLPASDDVKGSTDA